jgi:hypothetical protein
VSGGGRTACLQNPNELCGAARPPIARDSLATAFMWATVSRGIPVSSHPSRSDGLDNVLARRRGAGGEFHAREGVIAHDVAYCPLCNARAPERAGSASGKPWPGAVALLSSV